VNFITSTYLIFLVVVFTGYWALRKPRAQNVLLLVASYGFYSWWDWRFCGLLLVSSLVDYNVGIGLGRTRSATARRLWLILSITANLGMLGFFKYFNFFADTLEGLLESLGLAVDQVTLQIVLPVGISFYTFQTLSYTVDVYRGKMAPTRNLLDYMTYVAFFPQLVAGPIERAPRLLPQFGSARHFSASAARDGCRLILWGFFKKVVIADSLAGVVDSIYGAPDQMVGPQLALATLCFAFQIYCDFSGYSDIAIGTGKLLGIDLMRNFAYPYFAQSPAEFWRRWHISLSTWFRDYVYIPLGGSRSRPAWWAAAVMITFTLSGLWHGASWNFVVWGALNGLALLPGIVRPSANKIRATDLPAGPGWIPRPGVALRIIATFAFICFTWVFFRARTLGEAVHIIGAVTGQVCEPAAWASTVEAVADHRTYQPLIYTAAFVAVEWLQRSRLHALQLPRWPRPGRWALYTLIIWLIFDEGSSTGGDFIYFQF
jgi:D-alanyl-lipoteichoic acid acyltransferase DltB (MBOAT superfamily)